MFKTRTIDLEIDCKGDIVNIPQHSGVGDSIYKKMALDNPLSGCLKSLFDNKKIKSWLILDPQLLPFNRDGKSFSDIEKEFDKAVRVKDGLYVFDSTSIEKFIGFIYGDWTTIVGLKTDFKSSNDISLKDDWIAGNVLVYMASSDGLFWKICNFK